MCNFQLANDNVREPTRLSDRSILHFEASPAMSCFIQSAERVSPILVTLTSHSDSHLERSNIMQPQRK